MTDSGITLENMGPGLARMRACGDWIEINGPRLTSTSRDQLGGSLDFSGAWMGMDGWTPFHVFFASVETNKSRGFG